MRTSTMIGRALCLLVAVAGFVGTAQAQRTVTLRLNTATLPDTLDAMDEIQVRGAVGGAAPFTLPDGNVIDWGDATTLKPTNIGGDYWEISFQIPEDSPLAYKFYSQLAEDHGIGGWEDNPAEGDNHMIEAGTGDVERPLHFFAKGGGKAYDWRPYEQKEDSVAVWLRVYMATAQARDKGFIAGDNSIDVVVRGGAPAPGYLDDWSAAIATLTQESTNPDQPGYFLYSGAIYYPESVVGQTQEYKFVFVKDNVPQWEDSPNRTFVIPEQDTTIHWVYYGDSVPAEIPTSDTRVEALITFNVDVTPLEAAGLFQPARGDSIHIRGALNGWSSGDVDRSRLRPSVLNPALWRNEIVVKDTIGGPSYYKFYLAQNGGFLEGDAGYEEPLDYGGADRFFTFTGQDQDLGVDYYNNIRTGNVIPEGTSVEVTFQIDMTPALSFSTPFNPNTDQVRISIEDGVWEGTQAIAKGLDISDDEIQYVMLSDEDGDLIYTGTLTVVGPTYNGIGFGIEYGGQDGAWTREAPDQPGKVGRRRYQYILPGTDGSIPATYTFPVLPAHDTFPLPFECNPTADMSALPASVTSVCYQAGTSPTGIERVDGALPTQVSLGQNYPNPFNPETTFEYAITEKQHVRVRVYDLMGRVVATLVDGVQPAATYRVTFDGAHLASGIYLYQLQTPTQVVTKKMTLLK